LRHNIDNMEWYKILPPSVLSSDNFIRSINVSAKKLCIIKLDDRIFAVQNKCPHAGADLSQGWCNEGNLVCPYHRHEFDLETGRGIPGQGDYINIYPVEIRDDGIYVGMKKSWWQFW
jgi:nitrite reductase/ring-hydroxylating ferredoxin subunit